jgi:hypothetical protein
MVGILDPFAVFARPATLFTISVLFCSSALRMAAAGYDPSRPTDARACVRIALVGVIQLISELIPDNSRVALPLSELLYALRDLDHGKVAPGGVPGRR